MGRLSPLPSQLMQSFLKFIKEPEKLPTIYNLSIYNNYIQKSKAEQNMQWVAHFNKRYRIRLT